MLDSDVLRDELREFHDVDYSGFTGFPTTRVAARRRWADAFRTYVGDIEEHLEVTPLPINLVPDRGSILLDAPGATVWDAFFATLQLVPGIDARVAAEDFANAWQAAMLAVAPGALGATDPRPPQPRPPLIFASFDATLLLNRRNGLADTLERLFRAPSINAIARLQEIADAFHAATFDLDALSAAGDALSYR